MQREKRTKSVKKASLALDELTAARSGGSRRSSQYQVVAEDPVYDEVSEEEYAKEEAKKRDFIVDDDGTGFLDDDEPEDAEEAEEERRPRPKKTSTKKGIFNTQPTAKKQPKEENASNRIQELLMQAKTNKSTSTVKKETNIIPDSGGSEKLQSLIADLLVDPGESPSSKKKKKKRKHRENDEYADSSFAVPQAASPAIVAAPKPTPSTSLPSSSSLSSSSSLPPSSSFATSTTSNAVNKSEPQIQSSMNIVDEPFLIDESSISDSSLPDATTAFSDPNLLSDSQLLDSMDIVDQLATTTPAASKSGVDETIANSLGEWRDGQTVQQNTDVDASSQYSKDELLMYWIDAFCDDRLKPGVVFLFGKVFVPEQKVFVSCCVEVRNIDRELYVAPKVGTDISAVEEELEQIRKKYKIKSFMTKQVKRTYAFDEPNISKEPKSTFLKVKYAATEPALPPEIVGNSFAKIFGLQTPSIETFLRNRKLMGPNWLSIKNFKAAPTFMSYCKMEVIVDDMRNITKATACNQPPPPLVVLSISMKTVLNHKSKQNEIVALSGIVHYAVSPDGQTQMNKGDFGHFSFVRKLDNIPIPPNFDKLIKQPGHQIQLFPNEKMLLIAFIEQLRMIDPDVLAAHNFIGFDLDVLLHRMSANSTANWSRLGRFKRTMMPKLQQGAGGMHDSTWQEKSITAGRLVCDTYLCAKDLIREKTYRLTELAQTQLGIQRPEVDSEDIPNYFRQAQHLMLLVKHTENDAYITMSLMFKLMVLPLTKQLTTISGNLWSRSLTGGRAERIAYLLVHELHNQKYIVPDDSKKQKDGKKRKPAYKGGLVLEPKKGFYNKIILLLDFNSLYPSIVQEHNICFTTVARSKNDKGEWELSKPPEKGTPIGILPRLIRQLVERRRGVKAELNKVKDDPVQTMQLDIIQRALKLTANSMYGCLGFSNSRFYAQPLAELITRKGRETLEATVNMARNLNLEVIYGDTDSVMINSGLDDVEQAKELANRVKREVNKQHQHLEIELDGLFSPILLLNKKKYAALKIEERNGKLIKRREVKGLDLVRRDWCDLSKEMGGHILDEILSGKSGDDLVNSIHSYVRQKGDEIRNGAIPLNKFVITKGLTRDPAEYIDPKSQPHVMVALKMRQAGKSVRSGDHIPYVICEGDNSCMAERAFHPDQVLRADGVLKLDVNWYLTQQIHPPIARLIQGMTGTDSAQIAHFLGLDASKFRQIASSEDAYMSSTLLDPEDKYKDAEKFKLTCPKCNAKEEYKNVPFCAACNQEYPKAYLKNQLDLFCRSFVDKYYQGWMVCEEHSCQNRTRQLYYKKIPRCTIPGCRGMMHVEYSEAQLFNQLMYLETTLDDAMKQRVAALLCKNARNFLDGSKLFGAFAKLKVAAN